MKKSARLKVIIDLHARQEQDALQLLGHCQQRLQVQQTQLENLQKYRLEYNASFAAQQRAGINVNQLLEFRAFAEKLDKAIEGQIQSVANLEKELAKARRQWEECHQRTGSLQKVSDLALAEEMKAEAKLEQMEQDARAQRSSRKDGMGSA